MARCGTYDDLFVSFRHAKKNLKRRHAKRHHTEIRNDEKTPGDKKKRRNPPGEKTKLQREKTKKTLCSKTPVVVQ